MEIRQRTPLEEVYDEVFDDPNGLKARQSATEKRLEPIAKLRDNLIWPGRIILGAVGLYLTTQLVKLLERLPTLLGGP